MLRDPKFWMDCASFGALGSPDPLEARSFLRLLRVHRVVSIPPSHLLLMFPRLAFLERFTLCDDST